MTTSTAGPHTAPAGEATARQPHEGVAIDVGVGRGALVLYPEEHYRGREIEISGPDGDERRVHTGVHDRRIASGLVLTAVFGSLPDGDYVIWVDDETAGPTVTVPEGGVAERHLS